MAVRKPLVFLSSNLLGELPAGDSVPVDVVWGDIGGTLSDQTDLQSALNAKQATLTSSTSNTISGTQVQRAALTGDVTASANSNATTIATGVVTNAKMANVATATIKGRVAAGTGVPTDLTATQVRTLLNVADGATVGATWGTNLSSIPANITSWAAIAPSAKADTVHVHDAGDVTSGTFANARISQASVTQYQANLSIAYSQLTGTVPTWNQNTTGSAATLTTARTINGTSFNGSANITTANWGTSRNITIGSTAKAVNGSGNVSWSLAEIGAAASGDLAGYMPTSWNLTAGNGLSGGGTGAANRTLTLGTPSTLSGSTTNAVTSTSHTHALSTNLSSWDDYNSSTAMVLKGTIPGSTDLDTYTTTGWYDQPANANAGSGTNYPIAAAGMLEVHGTSSMTYQRYTLYNSGITYVRSRYLTTWYPWRRLWDDSDLVPSNYMPTSWTLTAGNGMSGGGNGTANRTVTLGTPGAVTLASTNSVSTTSHTHAFTPGGTTAQYIRGDGSLASFPSIPAGTVTSVTGGNGLTGTVTSSGSITLGTPGTITNATTNAVTTSSHTHALTLVSGDITGALGFTPANSTVQVIAGNGMTGGGTLAANRTLTLGTPGTINATTTNAVTTSSHTHSLDTATAYNWTNVHKWDGATGGVEARGTDTAGRTGFVAFFLGATRVGYIGYADASNIQYIGEGRGHAFTGAVVTTGSFTANLGVVVPNYVATGGDVTRHLQLHTSAGGYGVNVTSGQTNLVAAGTVRVSATATGATLTGDVVATANISDTYGNVRDIPVYPLTGNISLSQPWFGCTAVKDNNTARTVTVQPVGTQPMRIGTAVTFVNVGGTTNNLTIARGTGVAIYRNGTNANITLAPGNSVTLLHVATNVWQC